MRGLLADEKILLNTCSAGEHIPEAERLIRTVKDRARGIYTTLPFERMPGRLVIELVYTSIFWLNVFAPSCKKNKQYESS